jgi:hypothetical protein
MPIGPRKVYGLDDTLQFGRHREQTIRWVIEYDPSYIQWGLDSGYYKITPSAQAAYEDAVNKGVSESDTWGSEFEESYKEISESEDVVKHPERKINPLAIHIAYNNSKGINMIKKVVLVVFDHHLHSADLEPGKKAYSFFTDIQDIKEGDFCVADCDKGGQIVRVTKTEGLETIQIERAVSWLVNKIDMESHELRLEKQAKAQEIMNKLDEGVKQMERVQIYQTMAQFNPEMGQLMQELHGLDPSMMPAEMVKALPPLTNSNNSTDNSTEVL